MIDIRCNCEAYKVGICIGCDTHNQEFIDNNNFEEYSVQKECKTLKDYRNKKLILLNGGVQMKQYKMYRLVEQVLEEYPETRKDDHMLILKTIEKQHINTKSKSFEEVMKNCKVSFEGITRTRRAVQKERPELKDEEAESYRLEKEFEFRNMYK